MLNSNLDGCNIRNLTFQCATVDKALGSVYNIVHKFNGVVFDADANGHDIAYIENAGPEKRCGCVPVNVYVLDVIVGPPTGDEAPRPGFPRQGAP